ncbi:MAG: type II secretion system protein M [Candidatus Omnitrophica bacterium]|nr:type II secretion system protein M [Candidatus Omnitrophota bacterium]
MPKILSRRELNTLYITVGVVVFAIFFNAFLAPLLERQRELSREIDSSRQKLKKYTRLLAEKDIIEAKYARFSSAFRLPEQQEEPQLAVLSELESLANSAGIRITDVRPQGTGLTQKEISIEIRTEGEMSAYLKFIYTIEQSLSSLTIKKFQLNAKPNSRFLEGVFAISQLALSE